MRFLRHLLRRPMFSDEEIDLFLSGEDVRDADCGIEDGYTFYIYPAGEKTYAGYVSLRLGESAGLYYLGHIGYRIEEKFRGRGWAARACALLVPMLRRMGIQSLVITANEENAASRRTCEKLGCVLERIASVPPEHRALCAGAARKCRYIWRVSGAPHESP